MILIIYLYKVYKPIDNYLFIQYVPIVGWTEDERTHLSQELSDILIYLVRLSEKCSVDLPTAVLEKLELNNKKYPADKVRGSCKKYTEYKTSDEHSTDTLTNGK